MQLSKTEEKREDWRARNHKTTGENLRLAINMGYERALSCWIVSLITWTGAGLLVKSSYCSMPCSSRTLNPSTTIQPLDLYCSISLKDAVFSGPYATCITTLVT
jgi:hypothetical protein